MRISWLAAEEIASARAALRAGGATWDDRFTPEFTPPPAPPAGAEGEVLDDWDRITEHVARAERVSEVVRDHGLAAARARFADSGAAIEAATLASASHEAGDLALAHVLAVFACPIDPYVFYAPFLELLVELGDGDDLVVTTYEQFVVAYAQALGRVPHGTARANAARDGLADFYVTVERYDQANALFERRHDEDQNDVAVALSASRAFLAAGSVAQAVRWLGVAAARAHGLGRAELETKLRAKQDSLRKRLS